MYIWYDDRFTQMKRSNAHEVTLSSSGDVVHVFMSSFSEDAENTASIARSSVCMCAVNETARLCHSLTEKQMQDSYLNSVFVA